MPRPFEMIHLVSYDLPADKEGDRRRARLAKYLEGRGLRVQYSVFEVNLSPERVPELIGELCALIDVTQDSVRVYPLCATCVGRMQRAGIDAVIERDGLLVW
jgi:CRISPR-associated protein Cas2